MADVSLLPSGRSLALVGLETAVARLQTAAGRILSGRGAAQVWTAMTEALVWTAALDEASRRADDQYSARRDSCQRGKAVSGLVFARNQHAHELISAAAANFEVGRVRIVTSPAGTRAPTGRGTIFSVALAWRALDASELSPRSRGDSRYANYRGAVAGRPLVHPFCDAVEWFGGTPNPVSH